MNLKLLEQQLVLAECGDTEARRVVFEVLRPLKSDSVDEIYKKLRVFIRLIFFSTINYTDSDYHKEIDLTYAEQIHSLLNYGKPRYRGIICYGFRESAKTTRFQFGQIYMACYLHDIMNLCNVVSHSDKGSSQFTMDMFNILAASKVPLYAGQLISDTMISKQKESKTMRRFTTTNDVTYSASTAQQSNRGSGKVDIGEDGEILKKRPKQVIFDDIENEITIHSLVNTLRIRAVLEASILGMDQISGFWVLLGNYLSIRGNVDYFIKKFRDDTNIKIIDIPVRYSLTAPAWPAKYCATDAEQLQLAAQGINKVSIETIERENPLTFQTEFMNNPSRATAYFDDALLLKIDEASLAPEVNRDHDGLLIIDEPTAHDRYVMGVDCGAGVGKDDSAFVVLKITGAVFEEVANFKSNVFKPEVFTPYSLKIAERYNNAFIIPESNFPGNEYIYIAKQSYKNIYKEGEEGKEVYGVSTNLKTKPEMFVKTKTLLANLLFRVRSVALFLQIKDHPNEGVDSKNRDFGGGHFDILMAANVALFKAQSRAAEQDEDAIDEMLARINRNRQQGRTSPV